MRRWLRGVLILCVVAGLAASFFIVRGTLARSFLTSSGKIPTPGTRHVATGFATCGSHWGLVPSPYANGQQATRLTSVAAISGSDIWAVGYDAATFGLESKGIVEHWNGTAWSLVSFQDPGGIGVFLYGIAGLSASDVWMVGEYADRSATLRALIEHWDGISWSIVPTGLSSGDNGLFAIATVSSNDIWAVGSIGGTISQTLIMQWNGASWTQIASPNPEPTDELLSVAALTSSDVWVVGDGYTGSATLTLTEHWDGSSWSAVSSPSPDSVMNKLSGVAAISTNDVWAVGYESGLTLTEHWNGTAWSVVSSPSGSGGDFSEVVALSSSDVWAVGTFVGPVPPNNQDVQQALTEHWDGTSWSIVRTTNPSEFNNFLYGVAAISSNDLWAVGGFTSGPSGQVGNTLIEHYPALFVGTPRRAQIASHGPGSAIACA